MSFAFHAVASRYARAAEKGRPRSRRISQLGPQDQIVEWFRPAQRPSWMYAEVFASLPAALRVRELRYEIARPGFGVRQVTLVTTLLDAQLYMAEQLAEAYSLRLAS